MKEVLTQLNSLKVLTQLETEYTGPLVQLINDFSLVLSKEAFNVFTNSELINNEHDIAFLGYDALSESQVIEEYNDRSNTLNFFGAYKYENNFRLKEDMYIFLEDSLEDELDEPRHIEDLSMFLPLFKFQGDYILFDMRNDTFGNLITVVDGHIASMLAPSINFHIEDLIEGLEEGKYKVIEDELVYPSAWHLRKKVRYGVLEMDEYGECE